MADCSVRHIAHAVNQAVEVPAYERQDGVIYNAERIDASTIQALSGYYNWTEDAATLRLK